MKFVDQRLQYSLVRNGKMVVIKYISAPETKSETKYVHLYTLKSITHAYIMIFYRAKYLYLQ